MTGRECVETALLRGQPERLPCFPLVDLVYASAHCGVPMADLQLQPAAHAAALARCAGGLPIDGVYVNLCFGSEQARQVRRRDGLYHLRIDDALEVQFAANDVAAVAGTDIRELDDERIERAALFHPGMLETYLAMPAQTRREVAVCVGLTGAFSQLGFLLGLENLLLALADRPAAVHRALAKRQAVAMRQAAEICRSGARFIWIGEGMASGSLISPQTYEQFVLSYQRELAAEIRRLGSLSILHVCGNITASLPVIARSHVDGVDVDWPTDWPAAVEILDPRMCLKGNIDPLLFLPVNVNGLAAACAATRQAAPASGFILSTGCLVPRDATPAAFAIMAQAKDGYPKTS
jgi:uroporphyrinogen-III decarboxylase